ncbi:hypothetical protein [aff. Roholtiella sp. LEGE 12411]|uniref:hypothetical protein n=1 Tax=aff. Roholtiella sp. LEGE 12411 TaxID=1828822 RepID=UPI0018813DD3|nr:hypothetical protein [aff. Roholtiella sp. LEGE 12411]MBE9038606.1 hypothetical protein [aff. Roholtiella sp. LEGE 12411]
MQALLIFMARTRKRKPVSYRIDELVVETLAKLAREQNTSVNRYLETHFFKIGKERGLISPEIELIGETRGGDTTKGDDDD